MANIWGKVMEKQTSDFIPLIFSNKHNRVCSADCKQIRVCNLFDTKQNGI
jgi:hypothetical protein